MLSQTDVKVLAEVPHISVDQLVVASAAATFINIQDHQASVTTSLGQYDFKEAYLPRFDISLVVDDAHTSAEELGAYFQFDLFDESFLRRFCADLLLGSTNPTRGMLESEFNALRRVAWLAEDEMKNSGEDGHLKAEVCAFYRHVNDFVEMIDTLIESRVFDQNREREFARLLRDLGRA